MYIYIAKGAESEDYLPSHMLTPSNIDKSKTTSAKKNINKNENIATGLLSEKEEVIIIKHRDVNCNTSSMTIYLAQMAFGEISETSAIE